MESYVITVGPGYNSNASVLRLFAKGTICTQLIPALAIFQPIYSNVSLLIINKGIKILFLI